MAEIIDVKKLKKIRENYPNTWDWMRHKANWEHMCMGAVLSNYENYIDELMRKEEGAV